VVSTGERGEYVLPLLPVGAYSVQIEATGFQTFRQERVELSANENVRVDTQMKVGAISDSVLVTAEAPQVDSRSSVVGTLIDSRRVVDIPINGRNVLGLASLLPGVSQLSAPQSFTGDRDGATIAISGSRPTQNAFLFDGGFFNALFRNSGLNYPPPDALPAAKPKLVQNQFGGTLGGPIRKNKLFLFGPYEGLRIRPATLAASSFPLTAAERAGDFSASTAAIRDPLTNQPFPNKQIPVSRFDPVSAQILSKGLMPLPNLPGGQYRTKYPSPQDNNNLLVRTDYSAGAHTMEGRYYWNKAKASTYSGDIPSYFPPRVGAVGAPVECLRICAGRLESQQTPDVEPGAALRTSAAMGAAGRPVEHVPRRAEVHEDPHRADGDCVPG
jgi:hypothetical protein